MKNDDTAEAWNLWEGELDAWRHARPGTSIEAIYKQYQQLVWKKLRRSSVGIDSAADLHQEVFLSLDRLIHKKGLPKNVPGMLTTIARCAIYSHQKMLKRCPQIDAEVEADDLPAGEPDVEQRMGGAEQKRIVEVILAKLPWEAAMLIRWIDLDDMSYEEAARILERPMKTVQTQHRRARERFRQLGERLYKKADLGGES